MANIGPFFAHDCNYYCRDGIHAVRAVTEAIDQERLQREIDILSEGTVAITAIKEAPEQNWNPNEKGWTSIGPETERAIIPVIVYVKVRYLALQEGTMP
jgi:hypothetical protein